MGMVQVWRLDLGSLSPRRTHNVKIGYIPILMQLLNVNAIQVLVVPKIVGFSIPRGKPKPNPVPPGDKSVAPLTILVIPRGQGKSTTHL